MLKSVKRIVKKLLPSKPVQAVELTPFGKRIQERHRLLWKEKHPGIHDAETCRNELLSRDDPLSTWHCCALWQRKLSNKWNAREFPSKFGCRVPDLYWHGRDVASIDFAALPSHYVIRPTIGHSNKGVFVMAEGVNLFDEQAYSENKLRKLLTQMLAENPNIDILVEEFVRSEDGHYGLATDYKLFMFDGKVGAIKATRRQSAKVAKRRYYTENWEPFSNPITVEKKPLDSVIEPPNCLPEIIESAKRLSKIYGIFVRLDFYATDKGSVFGEFTPTPSLGQGLTDYASQYFLELWDEAYPVSKYI